MIYTALTKKAMKISFDAHKNQVDKSGIPYVFHPFHLAEQMTDEDTTIAALLHDTVEDTNLTFDYLREQGIPEHIIVALKLLTHDESVPYLDYIKLIKVNDIAKAVKIADLKHNIDLTRLDEIGEKDMARVEKYKKAIETLENNMSH